MSPDMNAFLGNVKRAAVEAVRAGNPFAFNLGKVISAEPLKVQVDQKLELTAAQLILTNAVRETEDAAGGSVPSHKHAYMGTKPYRVHLSLKAGEQVLLLRADGGQKYIVLDRVEAPA